MFCFFFQAEDGIRDLVRSRGLGDVYKRQSQYPGDVGGQVHHVRQVQHERRFGHVRRGAVRGAVSYTHLTLPTIYSV